MNEWYRFKHALILALLDSELNKLSTEYKKLYKLCH